MRIHADKLTKEQVYDAAERLGLTVKEVSLHGSRSRGHALNVFVSGSGKTGGQWGNHTGQAATWDEWGMLLEKLFTLDDTITVPNVYDDYDHFTWATGARFQDLEKEDQHYQHKWEYDGQSVSGSYSVHSCKGSKATPCTATTRRMANGHSFEEIR